MRFSTAIAIAFSASASLVTAADKCDAQNIVDACVAGYQDRIKGCQDKANDWICMCDVYTDVQTCYNNCPKSNEKPPVDNQVIQYCTAAEPLRAAASASLASVASVAKTATTAAPTSSATASATGSSSASASSAAPFQTGAAGVIGAPAGAALVALVGAVGLF
jgi:hypothetical protein